jgi:hypothetical protein
MTNAHEVEIKVLIIVLAIGANLIFRTLNWSIGTIVYPPVATCLPAGVVMSGQSRN